MLESLQTKNILATFHEDESGNIMETIILLAIGAVVAGVLVTVYWPKIQGWADRALESLGGFFHGRSR